MGNDSLAGDYDFASSKLNLTVTVPLFSGGYRLARMQEARIARERADIALLNKRNVVAGELAELRLRLTEAAERVESARLIEETARRAAALARSSYANGVVAQLAVTEAVNKLDEASLGLQNAIFEYRAAWYDWELAASTPSASMTAASMPAASAP
jgi:outer membrane protein TolC